MHRWSVALPVSVHPSVRTRPVWTPWRLCHAAGCHEEWREDVSYITARAHFYQRCLGPACSNSQGLTHCGKFQNVRSLGVILVTQILTRTSRQSGVAGEYPWRQSSVCIYCHGYTMDISNESHQPSWLHLFLAKGLFDPVLTTYNSLGSIRVIYDAVLGTPTSMKTARNIWDSSICSSQFPLHQLLGSNHAAPAAVHDEDAMWAAKELWMVLAFWRAWGNVTHVWGIWGTFFDAKW